MRILTVLMVATALVPAAYGQAPRQQRGQRTPEQRLGWQLTCQAWTFREMSLLETLDTLNQLGIRYIEFFPGQKVSKDKAVGFDHNASPEIIEEVKAKLQATQVRPIAYGVVGLGNNEAEARKVFEFAKTMGIRVITSEPPEEAMPMLDKLTKEYNIKIAIHNHPQPSHYWSPETVLKAVSGVSTSIGACADTGHWFRSGIDPVEGLKQLKGHIVSLHFKDLNENKEDVPFGTGVCKAEGQLKELQAQGFRGPLSIEFERTSGAELIENVRKCVQWFHETAAKLAPARRTSNPS